jgi:hypothetical protein
MFILPPLVVVDPKRLFSSTCGWISFYKLVTATPAQGRVTHPDERNVIAELDVITAEQLPVRVTALEGKNTYQTAYSNTTFFAGGVETTGAVKIDVPSSALIGSAIRIDGTLQTGGTLVNIDGTLGQKAVSIDAGDVRIRDDVVIDGSVSAEGALTIAGIVQDTIVGSGAHAKLTWMAGTVYTLANPVIGQYEEIPLNTSTPTATLTHAANATVFDNKRIVVAISGMYAVSFGFTLQTTSTFDNIRTVNITVWDSDGLNPTYKCGQSVFTTNTNDPYGVNVSDLVFLTAGEHVGISMKNTTTDSTDVLGYCISLSRVIVNS